jgi:hypothetical protein
VRREGGGIRGEREGMDGERMGGMDGEGDDEGVGVDGKQERGMGREGWIVRKRW